MAKVSFDQACSIIKKGGVAALPTETVYGLAGDIRSLKALKQIFQIKQRPFSDPLIVHFAEKRQLKKLCQYSSSIVEKLSDYFHPGPLTLVLRKRNTVSDWITSGLNTVAVRMPRHPLTLKLMKKTNTCLAAPSANLFSKTSPTRAEHILQSLKIPVLDGGPCQIGIESTILKVDFHKKTLWITRLGVIGKSDIESFLKAHHLDWTTAYFNKESSSPGQFKNHYQPTAPFIIVKSSHKNTSKKIVENKIKQYYPRLIPKEIQLRSSSSIFARELYHSLRQLSFDSVGYVVQNHEPSQEDWLAIWDRLEKASCTTVHL